MRVLVELFDKELIENVLGACIFEPEIVVFLCDTHDVTFFKESAIYRLFRRRRLKTQPRFYYFDTTDPHGIRQVLDAVVRDYPGCVFDFTGGKDLVLLVAGACFAEMKLPGYYLDISGRRFINIRGCEALQERFIIPAFSADDIFAMAGATIQGYGHFHLSGIDGAFEAAVPAVFEVVKRNPRAWGEFVSWLQGFCAGCPADAVDVEGRLIQKGGKRVNTALLRQLKDVGALKGYSVTRDRTRIVFASSLYRKSLLVEGIWLELFCYVTARKSGLFDDVHTSVVVDWDGVEKAGGTTKNEVDVFLVKGVTPVFISCKMSAPSPLALSEIWLLSARFGGARSRPVMLTAARMGQQYQAVRDRAAELGIVILDADDLEADRLADRLWQVISRGPAAVSDQMPQ